MRGNIKKILSESLDWVQGVNEQDNFFEWFRSGPGRWVGRDIQWWSNHVQDVNYVMSALPDDILEMYNYSREIADGTENAEVTLRNLDLINEFVVLKHGKSEIQSYVNELTSFIKEFRPYFGEEMSVSDMVESVSNSIQYAMENNIPIHATKQERNRRNQGGDDLVQLVRGDVNEDFDWAIKDTAPFLEIGQPLTQTNPKRTYRVYITHGTGEDNATYADNWFNVSENNIDYLIRVVKLGNVLMSQNFDNGFYELINLWINGEKWVLDDHGNRELEKVIEEEGWTLEDNQDDIEDYLREWLSDELLDMGLKEYNSYYQEESPIERFWITYFDEFGVEHQVKVNIKGGEAMRYPWGQW